MVQRLHSRECSRPRQSRRGRAPRYPDDPGAKHAERPAKAGTRERRGQVWAHVDAASEKGQPRG
ncbi:hypothetical protein GCM10010208_69770 [Actinomadura livida]|nr:hypothetical protein GCM10010208_69770 [Actinomadura livida]